MDFIGNSNFRRKVVKGRGNGYVRLFPCFFRGLGIFVFRTVFCKGGVFFVDSMQNARVKENAVYKGISGVDIQRSLVKVLIDSFLQILVSTG